MIKKLKSINMFIVFAVIILVIFPAIYKVASYQHKETHQGTITDKYNKRQDKEDKFYIVLDNKQVIENSDLLFKKKFDSADIQARLKIGDKVEV
ncbi:hypothetical protein RPM18_10480, partial [Staphylococcus aureus]|nr:hypothetical protein [Staphylococcus aureus]